MSWSEKYPIDIEAECFEGIEIEESDYSVNYTGYVTLGFGNCQINMSLEDFELLKEEIKGLI